MVLVVGMLVMVRLVELMRLVEVLGLRVSKLLGCFGYKNFIYFFFF